MEVSDASLLRFAWQAWHFVTFRRVLQRVENRFAWQAQYICDVFRKCVAVFVADAALWTCSSSFVVAVPHTYIALGVYHYGYFTLSKRDIQYHGPTAHPSDQSAVLEWGLDSSFTPQDKPPLAIAMPA